jgi:hypothetical protein
MTRGVRRIALPLLAAGSVAAIVGCGRDTSYTNEPRPPVNLQVAAVITDNRVRVSPSTFGAGPITMLVSNQTSASQDLTLETQDDPGGTEPGVIQQTGPINPNATAELQINLPEGDYQVGVENEDIRPAVFAVGPERPSGSNTLLLP